MPNVRSSPCMRGAPHSGFADRICRIRARMVSEGQNLPARRPRGVGFGFTYDKRLYDRLRHGSSGEVREHLQADAGYQRRSARFIENHDEPRSLVAFGARAAAAAAIVMSTLPGMRFYYDGQFEGRRVHGPVQLGIVGEEPVDPGSASAIGVCSTS